VLGRGLFSGKYGVTSRFGSKDTRASDPQFCAKELKRSLEISRVLRDVGARYDKSAAQTAIRWVLDKSFVTCALIGAKNSNQVEENAGAVGWSLDQGDLEKLNHIAVTKVLD
jgi:aryl-alcohol dehydrogenase-like predicted oxidoreductase